MIPTKLKISWAASFAAPFWYDTINRLVDENVEIFVEVGPGRVLAGLLKKILPWDYSAKTYNVANMKQLEKFLKDV